MEIYVIRHTYPDIAKGICYGQSDIGLAETFEEEKRTVLANLPFKPDIIYTSPLRRCVDLASAINTLEIIQDPRLKELNFGSWEMRKWTEIPRWELDKWGNNFLIETVPGGESFPILKQRVSDFLAEIKLKHKGKKVAIITHNGVIQTLLFLERKIHEKDLFTLKVNYGEVIRLV